MTEDHNPGGRGHAEFADYAGDVLPHEMHFAWSRLINPPALRGVAALVGGLIFLFSDRSTRALAVILAGVTLVWALSEFSVGTRSGRRNRAVTAAALLGLAVALVVWPGITGLILSRVLGGAIFFFGARDVLGALKSRRSGSAYRWSVIRGVFVAVIGVSLWVAPDVMLSLVIATFAGFWVVTGGATIVGNLTATEDDVDVIDVWPRLAVWLEERPHTADDRSQLYEKLFYEGGLATRRLSRFFLLMGFATTIAAFGVISDSTAVVIGAMLVAPLMTPLMGTSLSLAMGWPKRSTMSAAVALGGVLLAIGLSVIYSALLPFDVDPVTNSQVASRIAPTMVDLFIAVAAGGAGAFALSRPDVSDALPGVAVAIALVPPLAVVGLMLEAGLRDEAFGALLLFTTNAVAILLVGAVVFLLTGVVPIRQIAAQREWSRDSITLVAILAVVVLVVLGTSSERLRTQAYDRNEVQAVIEEWSAPQSLDVLQFATAADSVDIVVVGPERPVDFDELAADLERELSRQLVVTVRWVPEEVVVVDEPPE